MKKSKSTLPIITVPLEQREGVFVHNFKCLNCSMHFSVYSWKYERDYAFCPECGKEVSHMCHSVKILTTRHEFALNADDEIYSQLGGVSYIIASSIERYYIVKEQMEAAYNRFLEDTQQDKKEAA